MEPSLSGVSSPDEYCQSLLEKAHSPTFVELYAIGLAFGAHLRVALGGKFVDICPENVHTVDLIYNSVDDSYTPPNTSHVPLPSAFAAIPPNPLMSQRPVEIPARSDPPRPREQQAEIPRCFQQLQFMRPSLVACLLESNLAEEDLQSVKRMAGLCERSKTQPEEETPTGNSSMVAVASVGPPRCETAGDTAPDGGNPPIAAGAIADVQVIGGTAPPHRSKNQTKIRKTCLPLYGLPLT